MPRRHKHLLRALAALARNTLNHCEQGLDLGDALIHGTADSLDQSATRLPAGPAADAHTLAARLRRVATRGPLETP